MTDSSLQMINNLVRMTDNSLEMIDSLVRVTSYAKNITEEISDISTTASTTFDDTMASEVIKQAANLDSCVQVISNIKQTSKCGRDFYATAAAASRISQDVVDKIISPTLHTLASELSRKTEDIANLLAITVSNLSAETTRLMVITSNSTDAATELKNAFEIIPNIQNPETAKECTQILAEAYNDGRQFYKMMGLDLG